MGVPPSGPGCQPTAPAAEEASSRSGIPNAAFGPLHSAMEDEFNRAAGVTGWVMRDLPKMFPEYFEELMDRFGREEVKVMAGSSGDFLIKDGKPVPCEPWVRATLLISPKGMENLRAANATAAGSDAQGGDA